MGLRRIAAMVLGLAGLLTVAPSQTTSADHAPWMSDTRAFGAVIALAHALPSAFDVAPLLSTPAVTPAPANPYGLDSVKARPGALWLKWDKARADIDTAAPALMRCKRDFRRCTPAARKLVSIIKQAGRAQGRDRLTVVNRGVNKAIAYTADNDQWRMADKWSAPLEARKSGSFDTGKGDCEDYAIAKYVALRQAGVADADLQVLMVKDNVVGNDHAVLAARDGNQWLLLDNRWSRLLEESAAAFFTPLFALNESGVMRFERGGEPVAGLTPPPLVRYAATR